MFSLIVSINSLNGIGDNDGTIPWKNTADLLSFSQKTTGNVVIMGRKTWDGLPKKPLPRRLNVVITSSVTKEFPKDVIVFHSIDECVIAMNSKYNQHTPEAWRNALEEEKEFFIIGGNTLYSYALRRHLVRKMYITKENNFSECDVLFSEPLPSFRDTLGWKEIINDDVKKTRKQIQERNFSSNYQEYELDLKNHEEESFLQLLQTVLEEGESRMDRTMVGTKSIFAPPQLEFDLTNNSFPLLTTRVLPLRMIFEELMWFLRGQTDVGILEEKKVMVWSPNTTREFLDQRGLTEYQVGDMGPSYSFQFRHFGAKYVDCKTDYTGQGYDQLMEVIRLLKEEPTSRRILISLWNPSDLNKMSLPPCGMLYQFYVDSEGGLSTKVTQRSSDVSLAGGWNIASGALLTYLLAKVCGLFPRKLIWSPGDVHIYNNQLEAIPIQLEREPRLFPKLFVKDVEDITTFEFTDICLINYQPYPVIKINMNA